MKVAKVSELKALLSTYLARVKAGEEVVVTERGTPVAKLVPIPRAADAETDRMRRLEREGLVTIGGEQLPSEFWEQPLPADHADSVLKALLEDRAEGR